MNENSPREKKDKEVVLLNIIQKKTFFSNRPILHITLKSLLIIMTIGGIISFSDYKGYFNTNEETNHPKKKWNAFYSFTENNNIDVLLLGNSHLYIGINPKNLSANLGLNAYILAGPGKDISDTYFSLKEALKRTNPKLVVIETYGIKSLNLKKLKKGPLTQQFTSFYASRDFSTKITSTPLLFKSDHYFYAWSNTLRNHDFIFNNTEQLSKNLAYKKENNSDTLYLGNSVNHQKGIQDDILAKYNSLGPPVKGNRYFYNEYTRIYVRKIVELCKEKNIELMFLTIPMYYQHIDNYLAWENKLGKILKKYPNKWLNMQNPYDKERFTKSCFENTYVKNQHMNYQGSLIATYKLAEYIKFDLNVNLPNRKNEPKWINNFYGEEGYFENYPVLANDTVNQLLCENFVTNNLVLAEVSVIKQENKNDRIIIAKIDKNKNNFQGNLDKCKLNLAISLVQNGQLKTKNINLQYDIFHEMTDKYIFKKAIKPTNIKKIKAGEIICQ